MTDEKDTIEPIETKDVTTDDRGRAYLGTEYKDSELTIAILPDREIEVQKDE